MKSSGITSIKAIDAILLIQKLNNGKKLEKNKTRAMLLLMHWYLKILFRKELTEEVFFIREDFPTTKSIEEAVHSGITESRGVLSNVEAACIKRMFASHCLYSSNQIREFLFDITEVKGSNIQEKITAIEEKFKNPMDMERKFNSHLLRVVGDLTQYRLAVYKDNNNVANSQKKPIHTRHIG